LLCFALLLIYIFSVPFCTSGKPPENHRERKKRDSFATTDTALTDFEPRTETTPENQDSAESRVEFAPFK